MGYDSNAEKRMTCGSRDSLSMRVSASRSFCISGSEVGEPTMLGMYWMSPKSFFRHFG